MKVTTSYKVKIKQLNKLLNMTLKVYRHAVDFFIDVILNEWKDIKSIAGSKARQRYVEKLTHATKNNPNVKYNFDLAEKEFYKMPSYIRRDAITKALGLVSSYMSNLANYETDPKIYNKPNKPQAGFVFPALYRDNMFVRTGTYTARIKVFVRNTWDWIDIKLRKSDVDYITRHMSSCEESAPTLTKKGKQWFLVFAFTEKCELKPINKYARKILAVDLGVNNACVCSVMKDDGTITSREFLSLPVEEDCLKHTLNRIKKVQQHRAKRPKALWAKANGLNKQISQLTANFIINVAVRENVETIVFENLDALGKVYGSKKQRLALWKKRYVQSIATTKAHRQGIRVTTVNADNTSELAYDGSGKVRRGKGASNHNHSICTFTTGKVYHCDLNASYNIGARYFIREILKSLPEKVRLSIATKLPQCLRRSTCTLSDLISLNAAITAI